MGVCANYKIFDTHPSAIGHKFICDAVCKYLLNSGLIQKLLEQRYQLILSHGISIVPSRKLIKVRGGNCPMIARLLDANLSMTTFGEGPKRKELDSKCESL